MAPPVRRNGAESVLSERDDVSLEVAGRRPSVSGERKERERVGVSAAMDEGVLTMRVPIT